MFGLQKDQTLQNYPNSLLIFLPANRSAYNIAPTRQRYFLELCRLVGGPFDSYSFCFLALLDLVRVHAQAGPWGRPHAAYPIRPFERTFFTLQKKPLLSKGTLEICTRARPKTLPKKVPKNSFGGLSWAKNTETGQKNEKVCNLQKLFLRKEGA